MKLGVTYRVAGSTMLKAGASVIFEEIPENTCYDWDLGDPQATGIGAVKGP